MGQGRDIRMSRLLERATHLRQQLGSSPLTALPIIATEAQNITAYILTNLISTDGQLYELLTPSFSYDCNIFRTIIPDSTSPM